MPNRDWLVIIFSSALVSAAVNVLWNAIAKYIDHRRENKKILQKQAHIYLSIANNLELFAKKCDAEIYKIHDGLRERAEFHDERKLESLTSFELTFEPKPNWEELPIEIAAEIMQLPSLFSSTNEWVLSQWFEWADTEDTYKFEIERLAYYGIKACQSAEHLKTIKIGIKKGNTSDYERNFTEELNASERKYIKSNGESHHIPELGNLFGKKITLARE